MFYDLWGKISIGSHASFLHVYIMVMIEGRFDDEYFKQTEESSQFRQEYEMRRIKQARHIFVKVFCFVLRFLFEQDAWMLTIEICCISGHSYLYYSSLRSHRIKDWKWYQKVWIHWKTWPLIWMRLVSPAIVILCMICSWINSMFCGVGRNWIGKCLWWMRLILKWEILSPTWIFLGALVGFQKLIT